MNAVVQHLTAARAKIAQGWTQGVLQDTLPDGRICYCAVGALQATLSSGDGFDAEVFDTLHQAITKLTNGEYDSIIGYNDAPFRTQAEVLALFDVAIAAAQETADAEVASTQAD